MPRVVTFLNLQYHDGCTWTLIDNFIVLSDTLGVIKVPAGFHTDFNSVPRGLWNVLPPDEYGEAAVVHDYLYRRGKNGNITITRKQADQAHREFLVYRSAPWHKVWLMYFALRLCGWWVWRGWRRHERTVDSCNINN